MYTNPKNLTEQVSNLTERIATEMRVLNRTKVSTINGVQPDESGNVEIATGGGGSSDAIPKTGNRGELAGYNNCGYHVSFDEPIAITIDANSPDDMCIEVLAGLTLTIANNTGESYVKNVLLITEDPSLVTVNFGEGVYADSYFQSGYVNDLGVSMFNQIVVAGYSSSELLQGPIVLVSNKVIL